MMVVAEVTTTPIKAKSVMDAGSPIACPLCCAFCERAYLVKSGMLSERVAQKPTIPVRAGKKNLKKEEASPNFEGVLRMGPRPFAALMAQNKSARAATGEKIALKMSNFLMLSTPRYTTSILTSQKIKKQIAGPVSSPKECGKICGRFSSDGIQSLSIWYRANPPIQV